MASPLIEAIARALSNAKGLSPDALYQHNDYEDWPEDHRNEYICSITGNPIVQVFHRAWRRHEAAAQAALTAITEAGYAVVPNDTAEALESAVYVVRNVTGASEWHNLFGRDDPSDFDEDFRCWADHWQATHESVRAIATEQDQSISAAQGDGA